MSSSGTILARSETCQKYSCQKPQFSHQMAGLMHNSWMGQLACLLLWMVWRSSLPQAQAFWLSSSQLVELFLGSRVGLLEENVNGTDLPEFIVSPYFWFTLSASCLQLKICISWLPAACLSLAAMFSHHDWLLSPWNHKPKITHRLHLVMIYYHSSRK